MLGSRDLTNTFLGAGEKGNFLSESRELSPHPQTRYGLRRAFVFEESYLQIRTIHNKSARPSTIRSIFLCSNESGTHETVLRCCP